MKLDYHIFKSIANGFFGMFIGRRTRPTFFNVAQFYPGLEHVTRAYPAIRQEFDRLMQETTELPQYHEIDPGERAISNATAKRWNVFMLEIMGHRPAQNRAACPETCRALAQVPNMIQAFFSILDPGKSVPAHEGPYLGYLRHHLGVRVPAARSAQTGCQQAGLRLARKGEAVLFDDSWPHSVVNHGDERRAVLIVGVRRPLLLAADPASIACWSTLSGRHTYGRALARRAEEFRQHALGAATRCRLIRRVFFGAERRGKADRGRAAAVDASRLSLSGDGGVAAGESPAFASSQARQGTSDAERIERQRRETKVARPPGRWSGCMAPASARSRRSRRWSSASSPEVSRCWSPPAPSPRRRWRRSGCRRASSISSFRSMRRRLSSGSSITGGPTWRCSRNRTSGRTCRDERGAVHSADPG